MASFIDESKKQAYKGTLALTIGGTKGHAPGSASIFRVINTIPADKEEIKALMLQIEGLNKQMEVLKKKNQISEQYGRPKKKECEEWKEKYEDEKKSRASAKQIGQIVQEALN